MSSMATRTRCGLCNVNVSKQMLPLAYAFVPGSDLPSGAVLFRSSRVVSGTSQKKCCFREGAVSM
jgi:hypothetical protein